jgi:hypothetical protein
VWGDAAAHGGVAGLRIGGVARRRGDDNGDGTDCQDGSGQKRFAESHVFLLSEARPPEATAMEGRWRADVNGVVPDCIIL